MHTLSKTITIKKYLEKLEEQGYFLLGDLHYVVSSKRKEEIVYLVTSFKEHNIHIVLQKFLLKYDPAYKTDLSIVIEPEFKKYSDTKTFLKDYRNRQFEEVDFDIKPNMKMKFENKKDLLKYIGKEILYSERVPVLQSGLYDTKRILTRKQMYDNSSSDREDFSITINNYNKYFDRTSVKDIEKLIYLSKCEESTFEDIFENIITMPLSYLAEAIKPRNEEQHYSLPEFTKDITIYRKLVNI